MTSWPCRARRDGYATGASYRAYRERVRSYLSDLSEADQGKVLGGTAARRCGFGRA